MWPSPGDSAVQQAVSISYAGTEDLLRSHLSESEAMALGDGQRTHFGRGMTTERGPSARVASYDRSLRPDGIQCTIPEVRRPIGRTGEVINSCTR